MANYRISGVWKENNVITYYAFHEVSSDGKSLSYAKRISKIEAVELVENIFNNVYTLIWDYDNSIWTDGSKVHVVGAVHKFLRSNHDFSQVDNLDHLIDYSYVYY